MEVSKAVARYCIGHKMDEVAKRLGYKRDWIRVQLDYAGIGVALGGDNKPLTGSTDNVAKEVPRLVSEYGPDVKTQLVGRGGTDVQVEGDDAEAFQPYLEHYLKDNHEPAAAVRLAKAEWAGEAAVDAGVIEEGVNKKNERVNKILFPDAEKTDLELQLQTHMAHVRRAATFLDKAKMHFVKKESTASRVLAADAKWSEQVTRIRGLHPSLDQEN